MSGIYDVYQWLAEHLEDKRDFTPPLPTHPRPGYVYDADERERVFLELLSGHCQHRARF